MGVKVTMRMETEQNWLASNYFLKVESRPSWSISVISKYMDYVEGVIAN